jgi:hypothetical protein
MAASRCGKRLLSSAMAEGLLVLAWSVFSMWLLSLLCVTARNVQFVLLDSVAKIFP